VQKISLTTLMSERVKSRLSENQLVNLAGMLIPPIGLFLILPLAIHQSQFLIRLAGLFMTPMSGIILIGARALLFMPVTDMAKSVQQG
jgi:hypothetical protein